MQHDDWTAIETEIDQIVMKSVKEPFGASTIANVRDFVNFARGNCPMPQIDKGYWSTICFSWETIPPLSIEVFGDRFEVYRFSDGRTDIWHVTHTPGSPFPQELAIELPRLNSN